jgi:hypothetical protein
MTQRIVQEPPIFSVVVRVALPHAAKRRHAARSDRVQPIPRLPRKVLTS